jgi:hypothetical protein
MNAILNRKSLPIGLFLPHFFEPQNNFQQLTAQN